MLTFVNPLEKIAAFRLLEFLTDRKPWNRSLWGVGVVLAMDEMFEACAALGQGHLNEGSLKQMASSLQHRVGVHPAFTNAEKQFLRQQLQQIPRAGGPAHFGIRHLAEVAKADYLSRWARAVTEGRFAVEHFARSVAGHLLDAGFSAQHLHDVVKAKLQSREPISLPELCDALQAEMAASPRREFEVLLPFSKVPPFPNGLPPTWLRGGQVIAWLRENGFDVSGVRSPVAMVLRVQARDVHGAAHAAQSESDRYAARALIATGRSLAREPVLWVKGAATSTALKEDSRGVGVKELFREDRVFSADANPQVDAALELLAHLDVSSPPAAVAGGWGAIEGLLADPSNRASAADNMATLVTCSFPRAELTALSYNAEREYPEQCVELLRVESNRDRCRIVATMIIEDRLPELNSIADRAAVARLKKLFGDPGPELKSIRDAIGDSFHRLYRQRNLILHGARLDSVALSASLRTVAKLVGAGMDRITHGHYVQDLQPLDLVAKANMGIALANRDSPLACVDLLEVI